jgi:hypothetical protein
MQNTLLFLKEGRGVEVATLAMPVPATTANILAAYQEVLKKTPSAKMMLVTHLSHRTGLVNPVKEIIAMTRVDLRLLSNSQKVGRFTPVICWAFWPSEKMRLR